MAEASPSFFGGGGGLGVLLSPWWAKIKIFIMLHFGLSLPLVHKQWSWTLSVKKIANHSKLELWVKKWRTVLELSESEKTADQPSDILGIKLLFQQCQACWYRTFIQKQPFITAVYLTTCHALIHAFLSFLSHTLFKVWRSSRYKYNASIMTIISTLWLRYGEKKSHVYPALYFSPLGHSIHIFVCKLDYI